MSGIYQERAWRLGTALWPGETVEEAGLALNEEAGEVARALIKRNHASRSEGDRAPSDWSANLRQEIAQVAVMCFKMAEHEGFDLLAGVAEELCRVEARARAKGVLPTPLCEEGADP